MVEAYKNAVAELLRQVRFECRYEGLVTLGNENWREVLEPLARPVISDMLLRGISVDEGSLRAAGLNAYPWEIAMKATVGEYKMTVTPPPTAAAPSPVPVPVSNIRDIEEHSFAPIEPVSSATNLDVEPPLEVRPVQRTNRKSKKGSF